MTFNNVWDNAWPVRSEKSIFYLVAVETTNAIFLYVCRNFKHAASCLTMIWAASNVALSRPLLRFYCWLRFVSFTRILGRTRHWTLRWKRRLVDDFSLVRDVMLTLNQFAYQRWISYWNAQAPIHVFQSTFATRLRVKQSLGTRMLYKHPLSYASSGGRPPNKIKKKRHKKTVDNAP
jgi:hypothetical protein